MDRLAWRCPSEPGGRQTAVTAGAGYRHRGSPAVGYTETSTQSQLLKEIQTAITARYNMHAQNLIGPSSKKASDNTVDREIFTLKLICVKNF